MSVGASIKNNGRLHRNGITWLVLIVEAAFVLATLAFCLIAAFLAPAHQETFSTLASLRRTDFAIAVALATLSLVAALGLEILRRKLRQTR